MTSVPRSVVTRVTLCGVTDGLFPETVRMPAWHDKVQPGLAALVAGLMTSVRGGLSLSGQL